MMNIFSYRDTSYTQRQPSQIHEPPTNAQQTWLIHTHNVGNFPNAMSRYTHLKPQVATVL